MPAGEVDGVIVGVMQLYDGGAPTAGLTIPAAAAFCDHMLFLMNRVYDRSILRLISRCPRWTLREHPSSPGWNNNDGLHAGYHWANELNPTWVLFPDMDELLPYNHLAEILATAESVGQPAVSFPFLNAWETPERIVSPKLNRTGSHCKAVRGGDIGLRPPGPAGFCVPDGYWGRIYESPYPLRHLHQMTAEIRAARLRIKNHQEPWAKDTPPTVSYQDNWTMKDYGD